MLSATFHALIIGCFIGFAVLTDNREKMAPRVLELVAGEGDNYGATVAPKLGTPGAAKLDVPAIPIPAPKPEPEPAPPPPQAKSEPPPPEPEPAPQPKPAPVQPKKEPAPVPNFARQVKQKVWAAQAKAKKEVAKERAAEEKRLKKEEFDRMQKAKNAAVTKGSSSKVARIDVEGIAKGVVGGSSENKKGGAGGRALVASEAALIEQYYALLTQRVLRALEKPPGVSDNLTVTVVGWISASGKLSNIRVVKSSGSEEFDQAIIAAFSRVTMPEHPERKGESFELPFRTKDVDEG